MYECGRLKSNSTAHRQMARIDPDAGHPLLKRPARAAGTPCLFVRFAEVLPLVGTNFILRPSGAPREAITHHEVVVAREGRPSGRTPFALE